MYLSFHHFLRCHTNEPLISLVNEVIVNYYLERKQQEMVGGGGDNVYSTNCVSFRWRHMHFSFLYKTRTVLVIVLLY